MEESPGSALLVGTEPVPFAPGHIGGGEKLLQVGGIDVDHVILRYVGELAVLRQPQVLSSLAGADHAVVFGQISDP